MMAPETGHPHQILPLWLSCVKWRIWTWFQPVNCSQTCYDGKISDLSLEPITRWACYSLLLLSFKVLIGDFAAALIKVWVENIHLILIPELLLIPPETISVVQELEMFQRVWPRPLSWYTAACNTSSCSAYSHTGAHDGWQLFGEGKSQEELKGYLQNHVQDQTSHMTHNKSLWPGPIKVF